MRTRFVSDIHIDPNRPQTFERFSGYLRRISSDCDILYILGDLFEYWIGDDGIDLLGHRPAADLLCDIAHAGVQIRVMHGNRDFLIGKDFVALFGGELIPDPSVVDICGSKVALLHGDSLCTDDTDHQEFRAMVNAADWQSSFLSLPVEERQQRAVQMRKQSESSKANKDMKRMDVNTEAACAVMSELGVQAMIHGHVHRPGIHRHQANGAKAIRYVLGDWDSGRDGVISVGADGKFLLHQPD